MGLSSGLLEPPLDMVAASPRTNYPRERGRTVMAFRTWPRKSHTIVSTPFFWPPRLALRQRGKRLDKGREGRS